MTCAQLRPPWLVVGAAGRVRKGRTDRKRSPSFTCPRSGRPMHAFGSESGERVVACLNDCGFQCGRAANPISHANDSPGTSPGSRCHVPEKIRLSGDACVLHGRKSLPASDAGACGSRLAPCLRQGKSERDHPAPGETHVEPMSQSLRLQEIQGARVVGMATLDALSWTAQFASRFPGQP